jgi:hypothetical protein
MAKSTAMRRNASCAPGLEEKTVRFAGREPAWVTPPNFADTATKS